jgi:WD40 repeat protein
VSIGSKLLVTTHEGSHWFLESNAPEVGPVAVFRAPSPSRSFFTCASFSPDGTHVLAGSTDSNAYIWQVRLDRLTAYLGAFSLSTRQTVERAIGNHTSVQTHMQHCFVLCDRSFDCFHCVAQTDANKGTLYRMRLDPTNTM